MDEIYKKMIERIPEDFTSGSVAVGEEWVAVQSKGGCGAAMFFDDGHTTGRYPDYEGRPLKELAAMIDSPSPLEQGISMAAINAYYNRPERLEELQERGYLVEDESASSFVEYGRMAEGKDIAFVGHFCGLEMHMAGAASISVLEKRPQPGDLPAEMAPEVIPGKDYVFMTGSTLANCTASDLLALCREKENTKAIFVGPTTTLTEILFEYGAAELAGMVITDPEQASEAVLSSVHKAIFAAGRKVKITAEKK